MTDKPSQENVKYFRRLLLLSEDRGKEATGIAYKNGKGVYVIAKQPISATEFIKEILPKHIGLMEQTDIVVGHTRTPTQGDPKDNNNNHPVESNNWILVHNGSVTQMERIKDYKYKGQVDTEILVSHIETYGLEEGLPNVERGTASIAAIPKKEPHTIYLWREVSPLYLAYDDRTKTLFFSSSEAFLQSSLVNRLLLFSSFQIREVPRNILLRVDTGPLKITSLGKINVKQWTYRAPGTNNDHPTQGGTGNRDTSISLEFNAQTKRWEPASETVVLPDKADATSQSATTPYPIIQVVPCLHKNEDGTCFIGYHIPCPIPATKCEGFAGHTCHGQTTHIPRPDSVLLRNSGFSADEINRMSPSAKATIMYVGYTRKDAEIDTDGGLRLLHGTKKDTPPEATSNKYYFKGHSHDFTNWVKLLHPNKGNISIDGVLIKKWDSEKQAHYVVTLEDAIKEKLVDEAALSHDPCYDSGSSDATPSELASKVLSLEVE